MSDRRPPDKPTTRAAIMRTVHSDDFQYIILGNVLRDAIQDNEPRPIFPQVPVQADQVAPHNDGDVADG
jgi:hypothetical protein